MATSLANADTRDLLPNIQVPTLLVWGDADARSPMDALNSSSKRYPARGWS